MSDTNQTYADPQAAAAAPPIPPAAPPRAPAAASTPPYEPGASRKRGGIGAGLVLIVLGLTLLAAQFMPGVSWGELWPLIIVALGFGQIVTPGWGDEPGIMRVMDGIGTMLIGFVFLGNTLGYISWSVWFVLLALWPVLLIAGGIALIGKGIGQQWLRAVAPLVIWAAIAVAVASSLTPQAPFEAPAEIIIHPSTIPFVIINGK